MKICYEKIITDEVQITSEVVEDGGKGWYHLHPEFEFSFVESGVGVRCIGNDIGNYHENDLALIGGMIPHSYAATSVDDAQHGLRIRNIKFAEQFAGKDFFRQPLFQRIRKLLDEAAGGVIFPPEVAIAVKPLFDRFFSGDAVERCLRLLDILDFLSRSERRGLSPSAMTSTQPDERNLQILRHIQNHLSQPEELTLERIARVACLSPGAFSNYFRAKYNRRYVDFVNELRISMACSLLSTPERNITRIAYEVGFTNLSNFNRMFLKYRGCPPSEYRRKLLAIRN